MSTAEATKAEMYRSIIEAYEKTADFLAEFADNEVWQETRADYLWKIAIMQEEVAKIEEYEKRKDDVN